MWLLEKFKLFRWLALLSKTKRLYIYREVVTNTEPPWLKTEGHVLNVSLLFWKTIFFAPEIVYNTRHTWISG